MSLEYLNCWIRTNGDTLRVRPGRHPVGQEDDCCIRVSSPEGRRTWLGIETVGPSTVQARAMCRRLVRDARRAGLQIIADIHGQVVEVLASDRPTDLNRLLR